MMNSNQISKQMLDFNKMAFEKSFSAIVVMQEQVEKMLNVELEQHKWFPEEGKKAIEEWVKTYKKGREDFKCKIENGYEKIEGDLAGNDDGYAEEYASLYFFKQSDGAIYSIDEDAGSYSSITFLRRCTQILNA